MTQQTQTILIIGGLAIAAFVVYKKLSPGTARQNSTPVTSSTSTSNHVPGSAASGGTAGSTSFWDSLGSVGRGLNSGVSSVESTYNNVYDLFGGGNSSTNTGQGNNGTAG